MSDDQKKQRSEADAELEREIREGRKFTLAEAIGRLAGGAMKGESPIPRMKQAEFELTTWLRTHLVDAGGPLEVVLLRRATGSELFLNNYNQPLVALAELFQRVLNSDGILKELVLEVDIEWGRVMEERPYFEREGSPPNPDDPYTIESVRNALTRLSKLLAENVPQA